jgi:VanZ family protein
VSSRAGCSTRCLFDAHRHSDIDVERALRLWAPVAAYMAAIFYVSSLSQPVVPPGGDKPWHLLAYLGLGALTLRAVAGGLGAWISWRAAGVATAIAVGYAVTDELHQMFVPGRSAQFSDLLADAMGVVVGASLCWVWGFVAGQRPEATASRDDELI